MERITVHPKLVPYRIRFVENAAAKHCSHEENTERPSTITVTPTGAGKTPPSKSSCPTTWLLGWLKIYRGRSTGVLQTIEIRVDAALVGQYEVKDVNFDGYADIYFSVSRGAKFTRLEYWLFNPVTGRFANTLLAKKLGNLAPNNQEFDAEAKVIRTDHFFGACEPLSQHTYRIQERRILLSAAEDSIPGQRECVLVSVKTKVPGVDPEAHIAFENWVTGESEAPARSAWFAEPISPAEVEYRITEPGTPTQRVRIIRKNAVWHTRRLP